MVIETIFKFILVLCTCTLLFIYIVNAPIISMYLDERTQHKKQKLVYEPFPTLISIIFFAFIWVFFQDRLRLLRKDNYYQRLYDYSYRIKGTYHWDDVIRGKSNSDMAKCERYIKMRRIQKKIKRKKLWL